MTDFHLCTEGQRLWDEWDKLRKDIEMLMVVSGATDGNYETSKMCNTAWVAYQDHRAACPECTKLRTHKATKL
jgi:hypothetical protein